MGKKSKENKNSVDKQASETSSSSSESNYKYYFFTFLFVFPSLAWIVSVAGDVVNNIGGVFGGIANGAIISMPIIVPILIAIYVKKLRGHMLKGVLPVGIALLIFPSIQVHLCSPIYMRNEGLGTQHSLQATPDQFIRDSCIEHCLKTSKLPSAYQLSFFTPRVSIRVHHKQVLDLNLTTSVRTGGKVVKVAKLLLLPSWRKVKGKYHALNLIARIPLKVKQLEQALKDKNDMILLGKIVKLPKDLNQLKSGLEKQRRFIRPIILEVFKVTPIEAEPEQGKHKEQKDKANKSKEKEDKAKKAPKEEAKKDEKPPQKEEAKKEEGTAQEEEFNEEDYVPLDDEPEEIIVDE